MNHHSIRSQEIQASDPHQGTFPNGWKGEGVSRSRIVDPGCRDTYANPDQVNYTAASDHCS